MVAVVASANRDGQHFAIQRLPDLRLAMPAEKLRWRTGFKDPAGSQARTWP